MTDLDTGLVDEIILPDGYGENDDFFDADSWGSDDRGSENPPDEVDGTDSSDSEADDPTPVEEIDTGQETQDQSTGEAAEVETLDREDPSEAPKRNIRFTARIDHEDVDVDLDEDALPDIYQKAQVVDRIQAKLNKHNAIAEKTRRLSKAMGYEDVESMLESAEEQFRNNKIEELMEGNNFPREIAEDYVDRLMQKDASPATDSVVRGAAEDSEGPQDTADTKPDYSKQVEEFYEVYPEMVGKDLPASVIEQSQKGMNLTRAYGKYLLDAQRAELSKTKNENKILRQNQNSANKAPVKGVTGGGATDTKPRDAFAEGFDSYFD